MGQRAPMCIVSGTLFTRPYDNRSCITNECDCRMGDRGSGTEHERAYRRDGYRGDDIPLYAYQTAVASLQDAVLKIQERYSFAYTGEFLNNRFLSTLNRITSSVSSYRTRRILPYRCPKSMMS